LVGLDPTISKMFERNMATLHPAGGTDPVIVPGFVHMPASEGVERLLAHPIYIKDDKREPSQDKTPPPMRIEPSRHGIGIRVNQPMNFRSTYLNVIATQ